MSNTSYYQNELSKVKPHATEYAPTIKVFANGNGENTKHLSLNKESAEVLVKWLTTNFIKPKKIKVKILTNKLALATREICENLYSNYGATRVYDYANKIKLNYNHCHACEANTPTISQIAYHTCALCGNAKDLTK